jgi:hypothetical protein
MQYLYIPFHLSFLNSIPLWHLSFDVVMINKSRVMYCSVFCFVLDTNQVCCITPELYYKVNCTKSKRCLPLWGIPSCRYEWQYIFLCSRVWWCYRVSMHMVHYCEFHNTSEKIRKLLISNMSRNLENKMES